MKNMIPSLLMLVVSSSYAMGPLDGLDINFNETEPRQYEYCDKMISTDQTIPAASKFDVFKACNYGLDDARRMAERFGGGNGSIEGFLRGYAYGFRESYDIASGDLTSREQGQNSIESVGRYMEAGLQDGITQGNNDGNFDGASEARVRFNKAVDTNTLPSTAINPIARAYTPMRNAYNSLVPAGERVVTSIDDVISNRDERELGQLSIRNFPVYSSYDSKTWGEVQQRSWYDLWTDDGRYNFEKNRYYDSNLALQLWITRPVDTLPRYQALNNIVVNDVNNARINLQTVFQTAFREGYRYYVNFYFAKEFKRSADIGVMQGSAVGTQLGKRIAFGQGLVNAFNRKFEESAKLTYTKSYVNSFKNGFSITFDDYAKNPKLEISGLENGQVLELLGLDNDGIIQPGEAVALKFKVKNVGGVGTDITASLAGDILDSQEIKSSVKGLSSKIINSNGAVGTIDNRLESGSDAHLVLKVNNLTAAFNQYVTKVVKLENVLSPEVDTLGGLANVSIVATNVSIKETSASVSANLTIDGKVVSEINVGKLVAGQETKITLKANSIDPLRLIQGGINAKITLKLGDTVLESSNVTIQSSDARRDLINYFSQLINDKGFVPAAISKEDRAIEVSKLIIATNKQELQSHRKGNNLWKKTPEQTIAGMLRINKQLGNNSTNAVNNYDRIAHELAKDKDILPTYFFFFAGKKKAYMRILNDLSNTGKIK